MNVKGESIISLYSGVPKNFPSKRFPKKKKKPNMPNTSKSLVIEKDKIKGKQKKTKKKREKKKKEEAGK